MPQTAIEEKSSSEFSASANVAALLGKKAESNSLKTASEAVPANADENTSFR